MPKEEEEEEKVGRAIGWFMCEDRESEQFYSGWLVRTRRHLA